MAEVQPLITIVYVGGEEFTNPNITKFDNNNTFPIELIDLEKEEYEFFGFYTDSAYTNEITEITEVFNQSTLRIYIKANVKTYAISYVNLDGATHANPASIAKKDLPYELLPATKEGYTFTGWYYENVELDEPLLITKIEDLSMLILSPRFTINSYTITFDTKGGSEVTTLIGDYHEEVAVPSNPTKTGYSFAGWYLNLEDEEPYEFTTYSSNITLYAKWDLSVFTIIYKNVEGSTHTNLETITINDLPYVLLPATKEGYTFTGWYYENVELDEPLLITKIEDFSMLILSPRFQINTYTITFDTTGGSKIDNITDTYGSTITWPANPTKEGHTFNGWNKSIIETLPSANVEVKASWLKYTTESEVAQVSGLEDATSITDNTTSEVVVSVDFVENEIVLVDEKIKIKEYVTDRYGKNQQYVYIDIMVLLNQEGLPSQAITETNQPLTFAVNIPEDYQGFSDYKIIRIHNGNVDLLETVCDETNQTLTFSSKLFSTYAIVFEVEDSKGLNCWYLIFIILFIIIVGFLIWFFFIKNNDEKEEDDEMEQVTVEINEIINDSKKNEIDE